MSSTGFQFNDRDLEIVHYVYQLRVATLDHLTNLTKRSKKALERRLPKLRADRYLTRLKPRPHRGMYVIGPASIPVLIEAGYATDEIALRRRREAEWKDLHIPHALLVASIHVKLIVLCRESSMQLIDWQHDDPKLWDRVETADGRLPVQPDAHFTLGRGGLPSQENITRSTRFFLEADVGTMSHGRIAKKITAYAAYHQQQRHVAKFGIRSFHVAIVTQTKVRAQNLRSQFHSRMSASQRGAYHFISLEDLSPEALMLTPFDEKRIPA